MQKTKIAVLISGGGTNLQALIDAEKSGIIKSGEIVCVISSQPDAYGLVRAKNAGIPTAVVCKKTVGSQEKFEEGILQKLREFGAELIILAGFMSILTENFTSRFPERIINVHPALIPSFCGKGFYGLHVHEAALSYGVKVSGATVHFVNEIPDGGRIIMQKAVKVRKGDTPEILQRRIMEQAEWKILPKSAELISKQIMKAKGKK